VRNNLALQDDDVSPIEIGARFKRMSVPEHDSSTHGFPPDAFSGNGGQGQIVKASDYPPRFAASGE